MKNMIYCTHVQCTCSCLQTLMLYANLKGYIYPLNTSCDIHSIATVMQCRPDYNDNVIFLWTSGKTYVHHNPLNMLHTHSPLSPPPPPLPPHTHALKDDGGETSVMEEAIGREPGICQSGQHGRQDAPLLPPQR